MATNSKIADGSMSPEALKRLEALTLAARRRRRLQAWLPWLVIIGMFVIWEIGVKAFQVQQFVLPAPTDIAASMIKWWKPLLDNSWQTLMTTLIGFGLAVVFGLLLGIAIGSSSLLYHGLYPLPSDLIAHKGLRRFMPPGPSCCPCPSRPGCQRGSSGRGAWCPEQGPKPDGWGLARDSPPHRPCR